MAEWTTENKIILAQRSTNKTSFISSYPHVLCPKEDRALIFKGANNSSALTGRRWANESEALNKFSVENGKLDQNLYQDSPLGRGSMPDSISFSCCFFPAHGPEQLDSTASFNAKSQAFPVIVKSSSETDLDSWAARDYNSRITNGVSLLIGPLVHHRPFRPCIGYSK